MKRWRVRMLALVLAGSAACTTFSGVAGVIQDDGPDSGDAGAGGGDAPSDQLPNDAPADAAPVDAVAPACNLSGPFGAVVMIPGVNSAVLDQRPRLAPDELTLYFSSVRGNDAGLDDVFVATRASLTSPFGAPTTLAAVDTSAGEGDPMLSADQRTLFFSSNRAGGAGLYDLYRVTRPTAASAFVNPEWLSTLSSPMQDGYAFLSGTELWFSSNRSSTYKIFAATILGDGGFDPPAEIMPLSSPADDFAPVLSADGLTIYFGSNRMAGAGSDIFRATRSAVGAAFGAVENVGELNSAHREVPGWLSPDGCRLYLDSDRDDAVGVNHLYVASRSK